VGKWSVKLVRKQPTMGASNHSSDSLACGVDNSARTADVADEQEKKRISLKRNECDLRKAIIWFLLGAFFIFMFATVLDNTLVVKFHELGHVLAAIALNVKVLSIDYSIWTGARINFVPTGDWRMNVFGFAGGSFASLMLFACLVMGISYRCANREQERLYDQAKRSQRVEVLSFFLLNAIVADLMFEFSVGLLEGSSLSFYHLLYGLNLVLFSPFGGLNVAFTGMMLAFSSIALLLWKKNWLIWDREG
jgi:hypothetical protein